MLTVRFHYHAFKVQEEDIEIKLKLDSFEVSHSIYTSLPSNVKSSQRVEPVAVRGKVVLIKVKSMEADAKEVLQEKCQKKTGSTSFRQYDAIKL